jgi:hypothetical protein
MLKTSPRAAVVRWGVIPAALLLLGGCAGPRPRAAHENRTTTAERRYTREEALRMIQTSEGRLAPVYGPLA